MQVSVSHQDGITVVRIGGEIDASNTPELSRTLEELLGRGSLRFVLDMAEVGFIDSSGLSTLLTFFKHARAKGGDVVLASVQPTVSRILELTRLDKVFELFHSPEEAVQTLRQAP